jgi:hypothetical protein
LLEGEVLERSLSSFGPSYVTTAVYTQKKLFSKQRTNEWMDEWMDGWMDANLEGKMTS